MFIHFQEYEAIYQAALAVGTQPGALVARPNRRKRDDNEDDDERCASHSKDRQKLTLTPSLGMIGSVSNTKTRHQQHIRTHLIFNRLT